MNKTAMEPFYTESPAWHEKIGDIHALLERVKISEEQSGDALRLRKLNRIMSIHASTAIEGNLLTLGQVSDAISNSLYKYIDIATETEADVGVNVGANVGVNDQILALLKREPRLSAKELAALLNKTTRTVERHIKELREQGRLRRVGSDKSGHWEIIEKAP